MATGGERPLPGILPVDLPGFLARLRLTGIAVGYQLAAIPAVLLFVVTVVSLALTPLIVGGLFLLLLVPVLAALCAVHRRVTGRLTGRTIPAGYRTGVPTDPARRLLAWARDSVRWRDFAFVAFSATAGWAVPGLVVTAASGPISLSIQPFIHGGGWFFLLWLLVPAAAGVWWIVTPYLLQARFLSEAAILGGTRTRELQQQVAKVSAARSESIDHSAAELRRIERDLHDGAQARMVSLGMNLGLAEELLRTDPEAVAALLEEARQTNLSALDDLRSLVRGIHPPVLADRGLVGAVHALALDVALPVTVRGTLAGRAPAPAESAAYFAVAECLANVVKHSGAKQVLVEFGHRDGVLAIQVHDDGVGGVELAAGTGLRGVARRLEMFDGRMGVSSPVGGPTTITLELPCTLSSPKTSPSSGTG